MASTPHELPEKNKGDDLTHGHVNTLTEAAQQVLSPSLTAFTLRKGDAASPLSPLIVKLVKIVDTAGSGSGSGSAAAGGCEDLYRVKEMYWSEDDNEWKINNESTWCLDQRAAPQQNFSIGDVVSAWWSGQRGAFIPLVMAGGVRLKHGKVIGICNQECGTYRVAIVTRAYSDECPDGSGTN